MKRTFVEDTNSGQLNLRVDFSGYLNNCTSPRNVGGAFTVVTMLNGVRCNKFSFSQPVNSTSFSSNTIIQPPWCGHGAYTAFVCNGDPDSTGSQMSVLVGINFYPFEDCHNPAQYGWTPVTFNQ